MNSNSKTFPIIETILKKEQASLSTRNKCIDSLKQNKPARFYLKEAKILSINEFNQKFIFIESDQLLIKEKENKIHILYFENENEMISLNLDYKNAHYRITYVSQQEEKSFDIDKEKMGTLQKSQEFSFRRIYQRKSHTTNDFESIKNSITSSLEVKKLEDKVLSYLESYSQELKEEIQQIIKQLKNDLAEMPHNHKRLTIN